MKKLTAVIETYWPLTAVIETYWPTRAYCMTMEASTRVASTQRNFSLRPSLMTGGGL